MESKDISELLTCPSIGNLDYKEIGLEGSRRLIRLIKILPGADLEIIECTLRPYSLDDDPRYEALSYCWGDPTKTIPILCNGARLNITLNLESALRQFRSDGEPLMMWVDAICINQDDLDERSQQVRIMREIYQQAQRTVIWLGEKSEDSDVAISTCKRFIMSLCARDDMMDLIADYKSQNPYHRRPKSFKSLGLPSEKEVFALTSLFKRAWFQRIWVVQEVGVATDVIMVCGQQKIDFDIFLLGVILIVSVSRHIGKSQIDHLLGCLFFVNAREWQEEKTAVFDLLALLRYTRSFCSTDPRDKVFALFGLTHTDLVRLDLRADYHFATTDVYQNVALAILQETRDLGILETSRGATKLRGTLPSWVPDWSDSSYLGLSITHEEIKQFKNFGSKRIRSFVAKILQSQGFEASEKTVTRLLEEPAPTADEDGESDNTSNILFAASKHSKSPPPRLNCTGALCLSGHIIDKVAHVGRAALKMTVKPQNMDNVTSLSDKLEMFSHQISEIADYVRVLQEWDEIALKTQTARYPTGETQTAAYWQTLCAGDYPGSFEEVEAAFAVWRKGLQGARFTNKINIFGTKTADFMALLGLGIGGAVTRGRTRTFGSMTEAIWQRRLVRTVNGYLGLVPAESQAGDIIAILQGGQLPFVLRSRGGTWELIGASYIHGVMQGEAFDEMLCGEVQLI